MRKIHTKHLQSYCGDNTNGLVTVCCGDIVCVQATASGLRRDSCSCDARVGQCESRGQDTGLSGTTGLFFNVAALHWYTFERTRLEDIWTRGFGLNT